MEEVQVWRIPLDRPPEEVNFCRSRLSPEEVRRSEAFHFEKDRRRYAVARCGLRWILANRLGTEPQLLRFEAGPHGKPFLAGGKGPSFNLSHCEDLALVAVAAAERAVGIDVEKVRPLRELRSIEKRYFSPEERRFITASAPRVPALLREQAPSSPSGRGARQLRKLWAWTYRRLWRGSRFPSIPRAAWWRWRNLAEAAEGPGPCTIWPWIRTTSGRSAFRDRPAESSSTS